MPLTTKNKRKSKKNNKKKFSVYLLPLLAVGLTVIAGCACLTQTSIPSTIKEVRPGILQGYLPPDKAPNSMTLLPAPPAESSAAFGADQEAFRTTRALVGTPRWTQAVRDANIDFPEAPKAFSCALDTPITKDDTPNLYMLMHRSWTDAVVATLAAKKKYNRIRPFKLNSERSCTPDWEAKLAKDGSYPSGHTAIGWTWALILAEIAPERADAILSRGFAYGQSRVICGVHWQSDVNAGRVLAAAVVAKLHSDPVFRAQLSAAKKEWAAAKAKGLKPSGDCKAETAALAF
ncbi:MAG TPA: phosphatase PAP2 family protein [Smithellaceae bacterium]|nr:phosphatase PAP2 family protein [Smithellaceae bacterium]